MRKASGAALGDDITSIVRQVVDANPHAPARTLARRVVAETGGRITIDQARGRVKFALGLSGARHREMASGKEMHRAPRPAGQLDLMPSSEAEQITERREGADLEYRSTSKTIRTVEDLLEHIEADMTRFEVAASEATKWEVATVDRDTGKPVVTVLHRVFVRLKPRGGPAVAELVAAMIAGAAKGGKIGRPPAKAAKAAPGPWQVLVVADTHFAKYAWSRTTGGDDYDIDHADRLVRAAGLGLIDAGDAHRPGRRTIAFLGDLFHYDTPDAKTTRGTPLERDGRLERMVETGSRALIALVERSAESVATDCVIVPGNHDETMTAWFRLLLRTHFARDKRVTVHDVYTHRQYLEHQGTLLGFSHGDKARARLPSLMTLEAREAWARCRYREIHTGHLHKQAAKIRRVVDSDGIDTVDGVVVRTAPALCPPDDWHSQEGWIGSRQAMETWFYRSGGGLAGMLVADGTGLDQNVKRGRVAG